MVSRAKKTVLVYTMLIMASLWSDTTAQFVNKAAMPYQPPVYQSPAYPGMAPPIPKGYYNPQMPGSLGYYNTQPLNAAYWTGNMGHYPQPYPYPQNQQYHPYPYQHYPQPYGYVHPAAGYAQAYGHYPNFDSKYWGNHQGNAYYPYHGQQMYHPGQQMYHSGGQYYPGGNYMYQPRSYPYYRKPFGAGFLGGNGHKLVKGLVGATLVGVIAGKVARG